ncbi:hypothetical protein BB558_001196 [Smittium angustum]|uniref:HMG box domain-containing protein n=1 Tax=Smittium angustum TaxID=133377 RepID=A0A2U1JC25_SMIAN|nr:hypothetical protein BB558_001196 [Smittium angustum]
MAPKKAFVTLTVEDATEISNHLEKISLIFKNYAKNGGSPIEPKKIKDPNAPKRPTSSYILFCNEYRDKVKEAIPGIASQDIPKKLGEMWAAATPEEKKYYETKFLEKKVEYESQMEIYKSSKIASEIMKVSSPIALAIPDTLADISIPELTKIAPSKKKRAIAPASPVLTTVTPQATPAVDTSEQTQSKKKKKAKKAQ